MRRLLSGSLALLFLGVAPAAHATVNLTYLETLLGAQHPVALVGGSLVSSNPLMGVYRWQDFDGPYIYESFCIDLENNATGSPITYQCVPLTDARAEVGLVSGQLSAARANLLELLWGQFRAQVFNTDNAVAFQLAIYEIVYDGDTMTFDGTGHLDNTYVFSGGAFDGSDGGASTVWPIAQAWLFALDLNGVSQALIAWKHEGKQDQITEDNFAPVPVEEKTWGGVKALYQ